MLIDTHCHLHDREFFTAEQAEEILKRAYKKGVKKIVCIGTSHEDSLAARDFASTHDDVYWTYGIHPEGAAENVPIGVFRSTEVRELALATCGRPPLGTRTTRSVDGPAERSPDRDISAAPVAIGEVGLDYHYGGYDREAQIRLFEEMLQLASDTNLPVSFHVREAFDDFFAVISNFPKIRGVIHSFSDNKKNLKRILTETEFFVGVNGLATYSTLPTPPLERILLETDAPFLTPMPFRGIINECGYVFEIAKWLSGKLAVDFDRVERETTRNAEKLFGFDGARAQKTDAD